MVDFSKIQIKEQKLGSFGDIQIKAEFILNTLINVDSNKLVDNYPELKEQIKQDLVYKIYQEIYGDLIPLISELQSCYYLYSDKHKDYIDSLFKQINKLLESPK